MLFAKEIDFKDFVSLDLGNIVENPLLKTLLNRLNIG
jgi:hypothetical protein